MIVTAFLRRVRSMFRTAGNMLRAARSVIQVGWSIFRILQNMLCLKWARSSLTSADAFTAGAVSG